MRSWPGTKLKRRTAAVVLLSAAWALADTRVARATGPDLGITIVASNKLGALASARLRYSVVANPAEVAEVSVSSAIEARGVRFLRKEVMGRFPAPAPNLTARASVPSPDFTLEPLADGVYVHVVEVVARPRASDARTKPLIVSSAEYFRVAKGALSIITSQEYTNEVQPLEEAIQADGTLGLVQRAHGVDIGASRSTVLGTTPIIPLGQEPPPAAPQMGPRK